MEQNSSYNPNASYKITLNRDLQKHEQTKLKEQHGFELSRLDKDNAHTQELEKTNLVLLENCLEQEIIPPRILQQLFVFCLLSVVQPFLCMLMLKKMIRIWRHRFGVLLPQ